MTVMSLAFMPIWGIGTFRADLTLLAHGYTQAGTGNLTSDSPEYAHGTDGAVRRRSSIGLV